MITNIGKIFLVSLSLKRVQIFGRAFHTKQDARLWEADAIAAIESGRPVPDEKVAKYRVGQELERTIH